MPNLDYIIVQAGGKGTRLKDLTINKPKAIVSVDNLPIIYHLFRKYPDKKFIVIADYLEGVLKKYLETFKEVDCLVVSTDGHQGTCSGINNALKLIPPKMRFMIIWSDLILGDQFGLPINDEEYIGISTSFECRWSYCNGEIIEKKSSDAGIAGLFIFNDKSNLSTLPDDGEFVRWLHDKEYKFNALELKDTMEYGSVDRIQPAKSGKCRPFNSITVKGDVLVKQGIDEQGKKLAIDEKKWYDRVKNLDVAIPKIYSLDPFTMEYIKGKNVFEYDLPFERKASILASIMNELKKMHKYDECFPDAFSAKEVYYDKTISRLEKVRNLIPLTNKEYITINGKKCRNIFFYLDEFRKKIENLPQKKFCLIHGDCTFSNIILKNERDPIFIDPRGYFGKCTLVGDPDYDWAKLYYSLYGDYDQFNLGRFKLLFKEDSVELSIKTNDWRCTEDIFIKLLPKDSDINTIRLIHALIWLSLTTYVWNDYDSICGAFYNGLYYLEDLL